jgi:hypothetical protein
VCILNYNKTLQTEFDFSFNNHTKKPYTRYISSPGKQKKLDFHFYDFSMILMIFINFCENLKISFTTGSLESRTGNPKKSSIFAYMPLAAEGARRR